MQHGAQHGETRARGPHPLPHFLKLLTQHCAGDRALLSRALAGLARYQALPPAVAREARPVVAQVGNVMLRDFGGPAGGRPVLVVPSLINPPTVLDLAPGNSLLASLAASGLRPLLVDWGNAPEPLGLAALVEARLAPLLAEIGAPVPVIGYCLGGTLAIGLAAMGGVSRLALLATPWHFTGYGDAARAGLHDWWTATEPLASRLGGVPMDLLQPAFWTLDEPGLVAKYAGLAEADDAALSAFAVLEDWSNTGPPLALEAAREMAGFYADDAPGQGRWLVGGQAVAPGQLGMPILDVLAIRDRIVPPAAALSQAGIGERLEISAGHVGMIVGRNARAQLWRPLARWLAEG
ncbi:alpha/beta hydrolase [Polymorphobacter multimanifer]|uniref:Polyhydroxyalkanoate synthase n=1 Tax=Polymorphobacter multimanifer TaxID=1070431 RepID=A0A841L712_9SPHN|nr:alpha/beta hydrolase [Polymorphobacter multimanifer]MBB6228006.1 polyhydroxyalkanoate synthase [Polymorphobacter multimanifer]